MTRLPRHINGMAFIGGVWGVAVTLVVWLGQLQLNQVIQGQMPLSVAIALSGNVFPFLSLLVVVHALVIGTALWKGFSRIGSAAIWLGASGLLLYAIYLARFSMGLLLIPSTILLALAGILATTTHFFRK